MLCGRHARAGQQPDDYIYVAMNMHWETHDFELPRLPSELAWRRFADTGRESPHEICEPSQEKLLAGQRRLRLLPRSVVVCVGRPQVAPTVP